MTALTDEEVITFARIWMSIDPSEHQELCRVGNAVHQSTPMARADRIDECFRIAVRAARNTKTIVAITDIDIDDAEREMFADSIIRRNWSSTASVNEHRKHVGKRIFQIRNKKGLTQQALGKASGLNQGHISLIEKGTMCVTYRTLSKIAVALNVSAFDIDCSFDEVGDRVRSLRSAANANLDQLAKITNISTTRLDNIENNSCKPNDAEIRSLAHAFRTKEDEIDPTYFTRNKPDPS